MRTWWAGGAALAVLLVLVGGGLRPGSGAGSAPAPLPGHPAPELYLTTLDGRQTDLRYFRGTAVVVNFWATWCGPCRMELPELVAFAGAQPAGIHVISVNMTSTETAPAAVGRFARETGINFPVLLDTDGAAARRFQVVSVPTTFFIGPDMRIAAKVAGPMTRRAMGEYLRATVSGAGSPMAGALWQLPAPPASIDLGGPALQLPLALAFAGVGLAAWLARRGAARHGFPPDALTDLVLYTGLIALLASRLVYALFDPLGYLRRPWLLLLQGGPAGTRAAAGAGLLWLTWHLWRLCRAAPGGLATLLDALAVPVAWGTALALLGWPDPAALSAAALAAGTALALSALARRPLPPGALILAAITLGGLAAVVADFGHPVRALAGGVSGLQLAAAAAAILAAALAWRRLATEQMRS